MHSISYLAGRTQYRNYDISPFIAALNDLLTSLPKNMGIVVGRNRYFARPIAEPFRLGGGVEVWKGLCASMRPVYKQLMINANLCKAPFYTAGNLVLVMNAFQDASFGARMDDFFRGIRIEATHLGHQKIVKGFASHTAKTYSFDTSEYGRVTVEQYFRQSKLVCTSVLVFFDSIVFPRIQHSSAVP